MDKKLFRQRLEQLAVVKDRKPARNSGQRTEYEWTTEIDENGEEIDVKIPIKLTNDTLGIDLVKIKPTDRVCELGCGKIVTDQKIERKMHIFPAKHWRTRCANCNLTVSPDGSELLSSTKANAAFQYYVKYRR